jgi:hypothetical protein
MAYFGRKDKKPGAVPGAANGKEVEATRQRLVGVQRLAVAGRQGRSGRALRNNRAVRSAR